MSTEIPNPYDLKDSANRIETIAATKGGEAALKALTALSNEYIADGGEGRKQKDPDQVKAIMEQVKKDSNGVYFTEIAAAWLKDNDGVIVNKDQPVTKPDLDRTSKLLNLSQSPDPVASEVLDFSSQHFDIFSGIAGKAALSEADLGNVSAALDKKGLDAFKHKLCDSEDAKMVASLLKDNGRLFKTVVTMTDHGQARDYIRYSDVEEFLKLETNNPGMFPKEQVDAVKVLQKDWDTFSSRGVVFWKTYVDKDTLAQGLGVASDSAWQVMNDALKKM